MIILLLICCSGRESLYAFSSADSLKFALKHADPDEMPGIYNRLAESRLNEQKTIQAIQYSDTAYRLATLNNQDKQAAKALFIKGKAYSEINTTDSALHYLHRAHEMYHKLPDQPAAAEAITLIAEIHLSESRYRNAIEAYEQMYDMGQKENDSALIAESLTRIALSFDNWEKYDSAYIYYSRALKHILHTGDKSRESLVRNNLGTIYLSWGNYGNALEQYLASLRLCELLSDSTGCSKALNNIGIIYYDWGEKEKSLKYYTQSYRIDSLLGDHLGQSQTLNNIAIIYDESNHDDKALRVYEHSLKLAEQAGDNYQIAVTNSNIGGVYLEAEKYNKAELFYLKTLKHYQMANSTIGIAECYILLGDLYLEKEEYNEALQYYRKSLDIVLPLNLSTVIMNAYSSMDKVYRKQGKFDSAYKYMNAYHRINDSIFTVENSNQIALLTNAYEVEKKDAEMELQKTKLAEQETQIYRQKLFVSILAGAFFLTMLLIVLLARQYRLRLKAWKKLIEKHEELLLNRQELLIAKEKAEESDRLKSTFLVNLSHELRTPMNGIMGFTDLLRKGTATEEQQQTYLGYIAASGRQLLKVLNDIIDISAIETNQLKLSEEKCDLHRIFSDLYHFFQLEKKEMGKDHLTLRFINPEENPRIFIQCDKKRLAQVLHNLINNAIGFTSEGQVEFGYETKEENIVKMWVKDTGIGIERSKFDIIFERFRQVDDTTTRQHGGSGLGLAISKELILLMGGEIHVESDLGRGSTFTILLPCTPAK